MGKTFILHDESVNTHGFRMLTSGVNLEEFRKNPVMLLNHDDWALPIGRWENIRIEGGRILADAVFDMDDPRAAEVANKVEKDFVRMASIGAWAPEDKTDNRDFWLPGQTLPTVTRWTVREASIVTIGANHNAIAFYDRASSEAIDLQDNERLIKLMDINPVINNKMSKVTELLKLQDAASEDSIVTAITGIIRNADRLEAENKTLKDAIDAINKEKADARKTEAVALTDAAIRDGRLDASARESIIALFDKDFDSAKAALAAIPQRQIIAHSLNAGNTVQLGDLKTKSWDELDRAGKLLELKDNAPDVYKEKFRERFGVEPTM